MSQYQPPQQPQWQPQENTGYPQWQQPQPMSPMPPPPHKPGKKLRKLLWISIAAVSVALIVIIAAIASGQGSEPSATTPTPDTTALSAQQTSTGVAAESTANAEQVATAFSQPTAIPTTSQPTPSPTAQNDIGVSQQSGDWYVTMNSVKTSAGDQAFTPKAGNIFLIINVTMKNTSSNTLTANSTYMFALRDLQGNDYVETALLADNVIFGAVVSGQQIRGGLVYEVPKNTTAFVLQFQPGFNDTVDIVQWNISN